MSKDTLEALIESTEAFFNRFNAVPTLDTSIAVLREEVNELIEAARDGQNPDHIAEEAADVMVTALGICLACEIPTEKIMDQARRVITKNDAKTHATHHINEIGKIARRSD